MLRTDAVFFSEKLLPVWKVDSAGGFRLFVIVWNYFSVIWSFFLYKHVLARLLRI